MSRDCPLVRPLASVYGLCGLPRLLRPLLTSRSGSQPSPFQARGEISPGKNAILHRTTAASTSPGPWPQELCSRQPARPGRRRLICHSCSSAHGLRSTLPPHARSPSRSCASLASLWPARPGTRTPKIAPMLGALSSGAGLRPSPPPLLHCAGHPTDLIRQRPGGSTPRTPRRLPPRTAGGRRSEYEGTSPILRRCRGTKIDEREVNLNLERGSP